MWAFQAPNYFPVEMGMQVKNLPKGLYLYRFNPINGKQWLECIGDGYTFDYKVYGMNSKFVERVYRTYHNTVNNLGILLNGIQGTGKTVTAKQICERLKLPVILINEKSDGMIDFISQINQDIIVFSDEYEKVFKHYNEKEENSLLSLMDGAMSSKYRRVFLLTTNEKAVSRYLLQRPSRIRYVKEYGNLDRDVVEEVVDDLLIHKEYRDKVIEFCINLELVTIDIVQSVVNEVNIHKEEPAAFQDYFNIQRNIKGSYIVIQHCVSAEYPYGREEIVDEYNYFYYFDNNDIGEFKSYGKGRLERLFKIKDVLKSDLVVADEISKSYNNESDTTNWEWNYDEPIQKNVIIKVNPRYQANFKYNPHYFAYGVELTGAVNNCIGKTVTISNDV